MVTEYNSLDERSLSIYEYDMINGGKALILKVYCTKRDNGVWELPAPQIFNNNVYSSTNEIVPLLSTVQLTVLEL